MVLRAPCTCRPSIAARPRPGRALAEPETARSGTKPAPRLRPGAAGRAAVGAAAPGAVAADTGARHLHDHLVPLPVRRGGGWSAAGPWRLAAPALAPARTAPGAAADRDRRCDHQLHPVRRRRQPDLTGRRAGRLAAGQPVPAVRRPDRLRRALQRAAMVRLRGIARRTGAVLQPAAAAVVRAPRPRGVRCTAAVDRCADLGLLWPGAKTPAARIELSPDAVAAVRRGRIAAHPAGASGPVAGAEPRPGLGPGVLLLQHAHRLRRLRRGHEAW